MAACVEETSQPFDETRILVPLTGRASLEMTYCEEKGGGGGGGASLNEQRGGACAAWATDQEALPSKRL